MVPLFERYSTWLNIFEAAGVVIAQFLVSMPPEMSTALWIALALRVSMAVAQAIKQDVKEIDNAS